MYTHWLAYPCPATEVHPTPPSKPLYAAQMQNEGLQVEIHPGHMVDGCPHVRALLQDVTSTTP